MKRLYRSVLHRMRLADHAAGRPKRRWVGLQSLEPRILFSVTPVLSELLPDAQPVDRTAVLIDQEAADAETGAATAVAEMRRELVIIDASTPDYQALIDDITVNADDRLIDVVVLDADRDGIAQISEVLSSFSGLDAVHIVSHGGDSGLQLGNLWLSTQSLGGYEELVAGWRDALDAEADLLLYGCNLAASAEGRALVEELVALTEADVAASVDLTGAADLGGDWSLELERGAIESEVFASAALQRSYSQVLAVAVDATSTGTTTGNSLTVSHTTTGKGRLMLVAVTMSGSGASAISSVAYNGLDLTLIGTAESVGNDARVEIWAMVAPETGTHDVVVTGTGSPNGTLATIMTFTGVDQATPLGTFASSSATNGLSGSTTITSAAGELVFGVVGIKDAADQDLLPGANQTEYADLYNTSANGGVSLEAGAPTVVTSWSWSNNTKWAIGGISIKADTSAPSGVNNTGTTVTEGGTGAISSTMLQFSDAMPAADITYSVTSGPTNGHLELTTAPGTPITSFTQEDLDNDRVVYVHDDSETTSDSFVFDVDDGVGNTTTGQVFSISVTPTNDNAPVITPGQGFSTPESSGTGTLVGTVAATDVDSGGSLQNWTIVSGNGDGIFGINASTGEITIVDDTNLDYETTSSYSLGIRVDDGVNASAIETVTITIIDHNEMPTTTGIVDRVASEDDPPLTVDLFAAFDDPETVDSDLVFSVEDNTNPGLLHSVTIDGLSGSLRLDLAPEASGSTQLTIRATDVGGNLVETTFTLTVTAVNDAPTLDVNEEIAARQGEAFTIGASTLGALDADHDASEVTYTLTRLPAHGTLELSGVALGVGDSFTQLDINDGLVTYEHDGTWSASDSFEFTVSDGNGGTIAVTMSTITVELGPLPDDGPDGIHLSIGSGDEEPDEEEDLEQPGVLGTPIATDILDTPVSFMSSDDTTPSSARDAQRERELRSEIAEPTASVGDRRETDRPSFRFDELLATFAPEVKEVFRVTPDSGARLGLVMNRIGAVADAVQQEIAVQERAVVLTFTTAAGLTTSLSAAYYIWALRGGSLLASAMSMLPVWQFMDPLAVLDESGGQKKARRKRPLSEDRNEERLKDMLG